MTQQGENAATGPELKLAEGTAPVADQPAPVVGEGEQPADQNAAEPETAPPEAPPAETNGAEQTAAPKKSRRKKAEPEDTRTPEQIYQQQVTDMAMEVANASIDEKEAKATHKAAKEHLSSLVKEFNDLVNRGPERHPLFDKKSADQLAESKAETSKPEAAGQATEGQATDGTQPPPAEAATDEQAAGSVGDASDAPPAGGAADESWRDAPINALKLPPGVEVILREADLLTVGKIADWTNSGKVLTEIPKIGKAKAETIEQGLEDFWKARAGK